MDEKIEESSKTIESHLQFAFRKNVVCYTNNGNFIKLVMPYKTKTIRLIDSNITNEKLDLPDKMAYTV